MSQKVLLTGFGPFGEVTTNPSAEVVQSLAGGMIADHPVVGEVLPVEFDAAGAQLQTLLRQHHPVLVVCLGVAASRHKISLERVAINLLDARIPDNAGRQPVDIPVVADGPSAYFTSLPIKAMREAMARTDAPIEVSNSAGTYVCNHIFYTLMHAIRERSDCRGGFVHLPPDGPGHDLVTMTAAIRQGIEAALASPEDLKISGGTED